MSHRSGQFWISSMNWKNARLTSRPSAIWWCVKQITWTERVLICWQSPTHVCKSFTRQIRVCRHERIDEKVGENRNKFYISPTVCQRVCRQFLRHSHTPTWVCQHEFANFSLPTLVCHVKALKTLQHHHQENNQFKKMHITFGFRLEKHFFLFR